MATRDKGRLSAERIVTHQDWLATFLAAAGEPDIKEKLLKGHKVSKTTYKSTSMDSTCCRT